MRLRTIGLLVLVGALLVLGLVVRPSPDSLQAVADWLVGRGVSGALAFALGYSLLVILLVPGSLLTLLAGFTYGPRGVAVVWLGAMLGCALAFRLGRRAVRGWVERRIAGDPRLQAVDRAVGSDGFRTVLLLRLSPVVPFNLLNYVLGATRLSFSTYLVASGLGILPGTLLYVLLGAAAPDLLSLASGRAVHQSRAARAFLGLGILVTLLATWLIGRRTRRALRGVA